MSKKHSETRAQFGKYKGRLVSWIVDNDPDYAVWLAKHSNSQTRTRRAAQSLLDTKKLSNHAVHHQT